MGIFDLPTTEWVCKNPDCKGECCSDGNPDPTCNLCSGEMKLKEGK